MAERKLLPNGRVAAHSIHNATTGGSLLILSNRFLSIEELKDSIRARPEFAAEGDVVEFRS